MKVSINWLRQFTDITVPVDELVEKIGTQLGAVESVIDLSVQYEKIVIAKVVSCEKHPNADKLQVCLVDDGGITPDVARNEEGFVQVVCGAPNVKAGLLVAWIPPGATVPSTYATDPFVLGARELRGVVSNGMLASASELAIGDDHDGIVEIELDVVPGTSLAEAYGLNDTIIDIENKMFTHRPDCFGIIGVAREVAGIQQKRFTSPDWYTQPLNRIKPGKTQLPLTIQNNARSVVPRFMAITMADVTVKPSPFVLQTYLARVGIRPINNIVDVTNYLMVLTGQPLHAYDADKLAQYGALSLEARMSRAGDSLKLLNGKTVTFKDDATTLITSNDTPVGIAGVMGGADTEVDATTKNIVIECANFDMYAIRRVSMLHGLFTDAVTRFNKGQSVYQNDRVLEEAVALMQSLSGGHVASTVYDLHDGLKQLPKITVETSFINDRLGSNLRTHEIAELLTNVECTVNVDGTTCHITAPFWRTDLEIAEDIVEEVGRLYGYDRLPLDLPTRTLEPVVKDRALTLKQQLRTRLAAGGANEVLTYGFVHGNLLTKVHQDSGLAFKLTNALSPDLQYFRLSLTPSLLEKVHLNIKSGYPEFVLFELGKVHSKTALSDNGLPQEYGRLAAVLTNARRDNTPAYYHAKYYVEYALGVQAHELRYELLAGAHDFDNQLFDQLIAPYEPQRSAVILDQSGNLLGIVGEYKRTVQKAFKLPDYTAGFELFLSPLEKLMRSDNNQYSQLSRFPSVEQDITWRVPVEVPFQSVEVILRDYFQAKSSIVSHIMPLSAYQKDDEPSSKQVSFRVRLASYDKTMTNEEVTKYLDEVTTLASDKLQATRI